jgi:hypothetical protein
MEHLKTYYSLERHLEQTVLANPQFELLNAIWKLNKRNLSAALANVSHYFPHYSLHERSHSNTIIHNIESFLGEERIKRLSPTDTWLLLMATFTHDLGMVVFHEVVEEAWSSNEFQEFLKELTDWDDPDMKTSGELLLKIQELSKTSKLDKTDWLSSLNPINIKNSVTLVVAEYMRRIHHKRSSNILKGIDKVFFQIASSFYSDQIPNRLLTILGEVAYLHGVNFYDIFEKLDYQSNGISSDKIHPRFIAAMLRLGDLLDIDDNRFNLFTTNVFKMPDSSLEHKTKHSSIRHLLVTPEAIEITADCPSENVYRLARNWFDWLEKEVENQSKEWSNLAPKDLGGASPQIPKGKIKVYFNNEKADDKLLNLRFQVSNQKIFEILEGASIYENAEFTFIRELVQNGLDASKIQLWKEIENGVYDFVLRNHLAQVKGINPELLSHDDIIKSIQFPVDLPASILENFQVKLSIKWEGDKRQNLIIAVEDNGTGISDNDLIRMTSRVGESRKKEPGYTDMISRMPFWLKPTGAFGIGLQSVFIIVDTFKMQTKNDGGESKEIILRSSRKGKYSSLTANKPPMQRGTRVEVVVPEEKFPEVFGTSFDWGIISEYDYFTDEYGSIYIPKIRAYIQTVLKDVSSLKVVLMGKTLFFNKPTLENVESIDKKLSTENQLYVELSYYESDLYFDFYEKKIGSEFILKFPSNIKDDIEGNWPAIQIEFFVRDIPVKTNTISFYKLSYSKLYWNFMSPESDKILSLTREKFLTNKKQELTNKFLKEIVPNAIALAYSLFVKNISRIIELYHTRKDELALIYFKIILTARINHVQTDPLDFTVLGDFELPTDMATKIDGSLIKYSDFLSNPKMVIPIADGGNIFSTKSQREIFEEFKSSNPFDDTYVVIWKNHFFDEYLRVYYNIEEIYFLDKGHVIILKPNQSRLCEPVSIKGEKNYLKYFFNRHGHTERVWNYASSKYYDKLSVVNNYGSGFESFPYLSDASVISPFKDLRSFKEFKNKIANVIVNPSQENIKGLLSNQLLTEYVTDTLITWIEENHPKESPAVNKEIILEGYRLLIADLILNVEI